MEDGKWVTINGAHVFVKDGQHPMDAFIKQKGGIDKIPTQANNRKNLVDYVKYQTNIDLEKGATERQFKPRTGLNIDSRKFEINEFNTIKKLFIDKGIRMEENGVYEYFIDFKK